MTVEFILLGPCYNYRSHKCDREEGREIGKAGNEDGDSAVDGAQQLNSEMLLIMMMMVRLTVFVVVAWWWVLLEVVVGC